MPHELTPQDIEIMQKELDYRRIELMPELLEEVKRTRAFGDLSENYEYKAAKQAQNANRKRIRYLTRMIQNSTVLEDTSAADEVGLFDRVELYFEEDDEIQTVQVVSTVRCDPREGRISRESPLGRVLLGRRAGDKVTVKVSDAYSYEVEIRSITKTQDDGSASVFSDFSPALVRRASDCCTKNKNHLCAMHKNGEDCGRYWIDAAHGLCYNNFPPCPGDCTALVVHR